jgi:hypothetical protein
LPEGGYVKGSPLQSRGQETPQDRTADVLATVAAERQRQTVAALAESEQAIASGDREPWTAALLHRIAGMGVDVEALVERYRERTAGRCIDDPNAYLLAMAKDDIAKRLGTTREVVAAVTSDCAAMADTGALGGKARAEAENRVALARQLGGGNVAAGYARLALIPDSSHRKRRLDRAAASPGAAAPTQADGAMQLGALLPTLGIGTRLAATSSGG